jgi:vanillate O-demethylase ferredoxin subunit
MMASRNQHVTTIVERIDDVGSGTKRFVLAEPEGWALPPFRPGGHVDLHLANGTVRTYSLCNEPADDTRYVVAVKREADGRGGSVFLHDEVRRGDFLSVSLPRGGYPIDSAPAHHRMIAGGIGVTPFLSMAMALQRNGSTDFTLHVLARGEPPLMDMLAALVESGRAVLHDTRRGRPRIGALLAEAPPDSRLFCCGPESLLDEFERETAGWSRDQIHLERFVAPPLTIDPAARAYELVLERSGRRVAMAPDQNLVTTLGSLGIDVPISCGGGICGACRVRWTGGEPLHRDRCLAPEERKQFLMACVARCGGTELVLDL